MILLMDVFFNYLTPITYGGAALFDFAIIAFIVMAVNIWITNESDSNGNDGHKEGLTR